VLLALAPALKAHGIGPLQDANGSAIEHKIFVKQIDFSTNEFIANTATIILGYGICATAMAGATAVGTPAAGGAVAATCLASDAVSFGGAVTDISDKDNSLWTDGVSR
jgi:hypothetical protein